MRFFPRSFRLSPTATLRDCSGPKPWCHTCPHPVWADALGSAFGIRLESHRFSLPAPRPVQAPASLAGSSQRPRWFPCFHPALLGLFLKRQPRGPVHKVAHVLPPLRTFRLRLSDPTALCGHSRGLQKLSQAPRQARFPTSFPALCSPIASITLW